MKSFFKLMLVTVLVLALISMGLTVLFVLDLLTQPDFSISIDGTELPLHKLDMAHWVLGMMGLGIAAIVVVVVVPLALLMGLAMPLLMLGLGLSIGVIALLGVGALALSPLLLLALLLVWLLRKSAAHPPA